MKYVNIQHNGMEQFIPFSEVISKFNYLFVTKEGKLVDLAEKIKAEGNNVKVHFKDKQKIKPIGGLVGNWESWKNWADVIVYDDPEIKHIFEALKKRNYLCIDFDSLQKQKFEGKLAAGIYKFLEGANNG